MLSLVTVSIGVKAYTPVLFTRISTFPYAFFASAKSLSISSGLATLPPTAMALPPDAGSRPRPRRSLLARGVVHVVLLPLGGYLAAMISSMRP
jgi:hypothetical protein